MKKLKILSLLAVFFAVASCSPERQLVNIQVKNPKLLLEYCTENYNPKIKETVRDSIIYEKGEEILVDCDSVDTVVVVRAPDAKVIYREVTKEIEDTRKTKLMEMELKEKEEAFKKELLKLNKENIKLIESEAKAKRRLTKRNTQLAWVGGILGLFVGVVLLRVYLRLKGIRV